MKAFDLVVAGELNPDLVLSGDVVPAFGQVEQLVDKANLTIGSSAAIFACGAARLGLRVSFIGLVGDDVFGNFMLAALKERQVDTSGVVVSAGVQTGFSVLLTRGSDRAILTFPGSIPLLKMADIDLSIIDSARHLHLGSYFLLDELRQDIPVLFKHARECGATISLDTNYDPSERWDGGLADCLTLCDIFLPNEKECTAIAHQEDIEGAMAYFSPVVPTLVVKMGEAGALAQTKGKIVRSGTLPVNVVDTVGAGDSFDAGYIYGFLNDWDIERSLRLACVCGALSTQAAGGTNAQPTLAEALPEMARLENTI